MCSSRSRTRTGDRPTASRAMRARSRASRASPPSRRGSACRSRSTWSCTARISSACRDDRHWRWRSARSARRDRPCAVLWLGAEEPRRAAADPRAARRGDGRRSSGRASACKAVSRSTTSCRTITRAAEVLHGRLGTAVPERHAVRQGAALPCRRDHSGPRLPSVRDIRWPTSGTRSPAFNRFRGTDWMPEPCRSCPRARSIWAAAAARPSLLTGDAAPPIRSAISRRCMTRWSASQLIRSYAYAYRRYRPEPAVAPDCRAGFEKSLTSKSLLAVCNRRSMTPVRRGLVTPCAPKRRCIG